MGSKVRPVVFERMNPNGHKRRRMRRDALALLSLAAITLTVLAIASRDPMALCLLPALALPAMYALRRYPGERIILRVAGTHGGPRLQPRSSVPLAVGARVGLPRGPLLLACSLAVRPPPSAPLAAG